jgi:hypothetical protein
MTPQGLIKRRQTMINKYGSYEAYCEAMRSFGAKGGSREAHGDKPRGFQLTPELARENGLKRKRA